MTTATLASQEPSSLKRALSFLFKIVLISGLITLLARKGLFSISMTETKHALTRWDILWPAAAAMLLSSGLGVIRWQVMLRAQGFKLPWFRTFELTFIGNFFNIALPGAVSGDLIKALYVGREVKGQRARAFGSILFDRIVGLSALVIVCAAALAIGIEQFWGTPMFRAIQVFISVAAAGFLTFYAFLFFVSDRSDPMLRLLKALSKRAPKAISVQHTYESVRFYRHHRWAVVQALLISVVVQGLVAFTCIRFAHALGEVQIAALPVFVLVPLGLLATAVPVLPGGVGTGHVAFFSLFSLIGSQHGGDIFTLLFLVNLTLGAVGGLIYLRFKSEAPEVVAELRKARGK